MCIRDSFDTLGKILQRRDGRGDPIRQYAGVGLTRGPLDVCLLYTSDAADERSSVDLGGRRIIKKKTQSTQLLQADAQT